MTLQKMATDQAERARYAAYLAVRDQQTGKAWPLSSWEYAGYQRHLAHELQDTADLASDAWADHMRTLVHQQQPCPAKRGRSGGACQRTAGHAGKHHDGVKSWGSL